MSRILYGHSDAPLQCTSPVTYNVSHCIIKINFFDDFFSNFKHLMTVMLVTYDSNMIVMAVILLF